VRSKKTSAPPWGQFTTGANIVKYMWWIFIPVVLELAVKMAVRSYRKSQDARAGLP
jgi:hypothetical protein